MRLSTSLPAVVACSGALLLAGCTDDGRQPAPGAPAGGAAGRPESKDGKVFGLSVQTMTNPFFVDLTSGLREVVEARGDRLRVVDAQFDSLRQTNDISDLLLLGVAAIFINPVNWESVKGSLLQAKSRGIAVIVVDAPVRDQELVAATVASDNVEAGRLAARALSAAVNPLHVAVLGYSVNKACLDRVAGFKEIIAAVPGAKVIEAELGKGTAESARPLMQDIMGRHPDINAVFAINDPAAMGVISAYESAGKLATVKIAAVDGAHEAVQAILAGKMLSSSAQFPRQIGKRSGEIAYEILAGNPVDKEVKVKVELITRDNAASFAAKASPPGS